MNNLNSFLLQALTAAKSSDEISVKDLLLSQLEETDPSTSLLVNYLTQKQTEQPETDLLDEDDIDSDLSQSLRESEKARDQDERVRAFNDLRQKVNDMYIELEELRARNDDLAAALGACYLCWGEDPGCQICGGKGHSGSFELDKELFAEFVIPAVHRQQQESATRRASINRGTRIYSTNYEPNKRR